MKYRNIFLTLALLPTLLCATYRERAKEVILVHDWTKDPNDQSFVEGPTMKGLGDALKLKHTTLKCSNLSDDKDSDQLTYVVIFSKPEYLQNKLISKFPKKKAILFTWEPPVVQKNLFTKRFLSRFHRVYTWNDDLVDNKKFFKFYYPALQSMQDNLPAFNDRKLLTQIASMRTSKHKKELYSARADIINYFQDKPEGEFEFYGRGWENQNLRHYKGMVGDKYSALKNYKFSVCYENMCDIKGYISEKIFDCFAVGTIPIYWGASNVTDFIPKECFIDRRDFDSFDDVMTYIRNMDEETYQTYVRNIKAFVESDEAKLFSKEMFDVIFLEAIRFP
ncbi:MAG: glycosyltransferase family 10 [Rhabdochlamydiaceae bacterium]|jgi:hypothetical protein